MKNYALLDSGHGEKLEQFGPISLVRPAAQASWEPKYDKKIWQQAHGHFTRKKGLCWRKHALPDSWNVELEGLTFKLSTTDFGHLGIFPEQRRQLAWMRAQCMDRKLNVLNLFAYSGAATLACAQAHASVCHLDASKGMVAWARENAALNHLEKAPIRWIVDDAIKFIDRELKRGKNYDAIILSPPSFGRGNNGEVFTIDTHIIPLLKKCQQLLSNNVKFFLVSCHTPGYTPQVLKNHLLRLFPQYAHIIESGELYLEGEEDVLKLPSGVFARFALN